MPPQPAFYHRPTSLDDIIGQTVSRILDLFGIQLEQDLFQRWQMKSGEHKGETTLAYRDAKALLTREQSSF